MANSLDITLEALGEEQIKSMLTGLGLDLRNMRGAMNEVARGSIDVFSGRVFTSRGQRIGQPWPKLSDGYAARKAKKHSGKPPLVITGTMRDSFKYNSTGMSVTIYNPTPYFVYHQSSAARSKIPRRAMIGIYPSLQNDVKRTIAAVIARKIKERST